MKTKILSIIVLFFLTCSLSAQIDRSQQPKPGPAPKINLKEAQTFKLKNGLQVLVVENHKLPRVSASLMIDNGPIFEGKKAGVSSLTGSLLGSGTNTISKNDFNEEVDYLGASVSFGSQSARMSSLSKYFTRVLELMADAAINPIFTQEEFDKEVDQLKDGIKASEKSVSYIAGIVQNALAYSKNHPYGEFTSIETVENISLKDVQNFYSAYFKPNNAYLVIVGDAEFKTVKKLVKKLFRNWEKGIVPSYTIPEVVNVDATEIDFINMSNAVQSEVAVLNTIHLKMSHPDYHAVLLANKIFGGGAEGRLFLNLREDHGFTYGAYSSVGKDKNTAAVFKSSSSVRNMVTDSAVVEILKELKKIRTEKVTDDELKNAKAAYTGNFVMNVEKPQTVARFALNIKTENLPEDFYSTYLQKINAVTIDDIQRVAQKYFSSDNARIVIVGKALDVLKNLKKLPVKINYFDKNGDSASEPELIKAIPEGVTAQTVIEQYLKAIGGLDNINNISSVHNKSEASIQGMTLTMETKSMKPNKQSVVVSGMGMVLSKMIFDGEKGYAEQQGMRKELSGNDLEKTKSTTVPFPETGYLKDPEISLVKIEPVNDSDAYVVKISDDTTIYYDIATGLKLKQVTEVEAGGQTIKQSFEFSDYKEVAGVQFPHSFKMSTGPQTFDFEIKEIQVNEGVSEEDFK